MSGIASAATRTSVSLPPEAQVALLERGLVDDVIEVVRAAPRVLP